MEASQGVSAHGNLPSGVGMKLGATALAVALALGLSACGGGGGGGGNVRPTQPTQPTQPVQPTSPPSGGSGTTPSGEIDVAANDVVVRADNLTGSTDLVKGGAGTLTLTGTNSYTGTTLVQAGSLYVDGDQLAATGAATVASGATLGGKGIIGGSVTVSDGATLAPGSSGAIGTLTVNGNLSLSSGSRLDYGLGDFVDVKGNLTLDGTLGGSPASGSATGPGVYRLMSYGGSLVNNGLDAAAGWLVQTGVAHQVNLVNAQATRLSFWDGDAGPASDNVVNGGNGTWQSGNAASRANWTDANGVTNTGFADGSFAVFQSTPGTVTVDASQGDVSVAGMQFASNGYIVRGDAIHLTGSATDPGQSIIRVGDGSAAGSGYMATIDSVLTGASGLVKTDAGTLVLSGSNTYTGGTTISGGVLQLGNGGTTGSLAGDVTDNAVLAFNRSDTSSFNGIVSGAGSLRQIGSGTLVLTGNNTYTGGTTVDNGILQIGNGGATGWLVGDIVNNKYVRFNRSDDVVFGGNISGTGSLLKDGAGKLIVTGSITEDSATTSTRPTVITAGTLQIGNGGTTGSIAGDITNNSALVFDRSDTVTVGGIVSGTGSLTQAGTGTLILANTAIFSDITISRGTLQIGNGGGNSWRTGSIANNGTLIFNFGYPSGVGGGTDAVISGSGNLIKQGSDLFVLSGDNTYTGGTLISGGTLRLGSGGTTGSVTGAITNNGVLGFDRSDNVTFANRVTGTGALRKDGFNTLTLTGDVASTGGTNVTLGTLQIGNGGTSGTLAGDVFVSGTLAFNRSDDQTFSGNISGDGQVVKLGGNTLTLTRGNVSSGGGGPWFGTDVVDGTLRIASGAALKYSTTVGGNLAHAVLQVDHGATIAYTTLADGATLDNAGLVHTNDAFTAVGGTRAASVFNHDGGVIETVPQVGYVGGAVNLGANSTLINASGAIIRGAIGVESSGVVTNDGGTITGMTDDGINGHMTAVTNTNGGQITSGNDSRLPTAPISAGIFSYGHDATISNLSASSIVGKRVGVALNDGGTVFNDGGSLISGSTGVSTYNQDLTIATVNNTNGARITGTQTGIRLEFGGVVNNGAGSTIETTAPASGDCSGTPACAVYVPVYGGVGNYGSVGTLTLSNAGFILGDVQMDPGRVNDITLIAGGYIHGALKIGSNTASTLTLDGGAGSSQLYSTAVTGGTTFGGSLIKNGAGTWTLDNNQLQGVTNTSINAGSLRASQSLAGNVTVNAGGTLDGVPGVHGNLINAGKVALHGGDTSVGGNFSQASGGRLAVSLGSKLAVAGSAALDGTLEVTGADNGYVSNTHTDVLTATGGVTGTFGALVKDSGVVFTSSTINYGPNSVWLDTTGLNITAAMQSRGAVLTRASLASAQRVQSAFTQLDTRIASGTVAAVPSNFVEAAGQFQQAPTVQAAQFSLESLSGELHAASAAMTFEAIDASGRAMSDHFDDLLDKKAGYGMWTHNLSTSGDMGRSGFDGVGYQLNGWMVGSDQQIGSSGVAGFAFGQSQARQQLDRSSDRNRSRNTEGMFYAGALNGNWYTQGRIGFGHFQQDVNRQLLLGTSAQGVGTRYGGDYNVAYGESGLNLDWAGTRVLPFVNVEYANIRRDGFAEQGAGGFGLQANAQTVDRWQAGVGLRASRRWDFGGGRSLDFRMSAQFQRTVASRGDVFEASFVGLQQYQPLVGIGLSRYSGLFNVGLKAALSELTSLDFGYDYQRGQRDQAQMVSARLIKAF
ncbi:autotransporter-associated beta strand repeat-containing protein [Luteibacter sp. 9133]|uniref:autotransporter-associated beta strand repeat-containing protein n=1 Tax=Luteibacter sp. 9133 TaxID=1500891 RepID=UPI0005B8ED5C|nr:autotransporter-associated beta strand repeat-containing protein [Luteibacter sp. 9133]